jgi:hypothetical protein
MWKFLVQVLMQFGLGQQLTGGKFDWSHIHRHMTGRWPPLTLEHTCRYAELVMAQLSEAANGKPFFADGILKKEILQSYELNKVPCTTNCLMIWKRNKSPVNSVFVEPMSKASRSANQAFL